MFKLKTDKSNTSLGRTQSNTFLEPAKSNTSLGRTQSNTFLEPAKSNVSFGQTKSNTLLKRTKSNTFLEPRKSKASPEPAKSNASSEPSGVLLATKRMVKKGIDDGDVSLVSCTFKAFEDFLKDEVKEEKRVPIDLAHRYLVYELTVIKNQAELHVLDTKKSTSKTPSNDARNFIQNLVMLIQDRIERKNTFLNKLDSTSEPEIMMDMYKSCLSNFKKQVKPGMSKDAYKLLAADIDREIELNNQEKLDTIMETKETKETKETRRVNFSPNNS